MQYQFARKGHDEFIGYLKGICIIFVILAHAFSVETQRCTLSSLWIQQTVPLFLIIHVIHVCRNYYTSGFPGLTNRYFSSNALVKLIKKIILPFFLCTLVQSLMLLALGYDLNVVLSTVVKRGGFGPGSYYPWIYLQLYALTPFVILLLSKNNFLKGGVLLAMVCTALEIMCSKFGMSNGLWRLCCIKYIYLIYLGWQLYLTQIKMNRTRLFLSLASLIFILLDNYTSIDFSPLFYESDWNGFHWLAYFYTAYLFMYIMYTLYDKSQSLKKLVLYLGKYSWQIFLWQMFVFWLADLLLGEAWDNLSGYSFIYSILLSCFVLTVPLWIIKKIEGSKYETT
mgnify:CR=1 FL=1